VAVRWVRLRARCGDGGARPASVPPQAGGSRRTAFRPWSPVSRSGSRHHYPARRTHTKLVEDKANGPAVISQLRRRVPGLVVDVAGLDVGRHRARPGDLDPLGDLAEGEAQLLIERFALSANNVTYAAWGEWLGYSRRSALAPPAGARRGRAVLAPPEARARGSGSGRPQSERRPGERWPQGQDGVSDRARGKAEPYARLRTATRARLQGAISPSRGTAPCEVSPRAAVVSPTLRRAGSLLALA
jgi:hypothetical protein